jgi:lipoprotein-anchoring transpeptidase ErfK/SrfK
VVRCLRLTSSFALVVTAVVLASSVLPGVALQASAGGRYLSPSLFPTGLPQGIALRGWADLQAQNSRELDLARRVTSRLGEQVTWLQDQEIGAGVPADELAALRDMVGRDLGLALAVRSKDALGELDSELMGVAQASAHQPILDLRNLIADSRRVGVDDSVLATAAADADNAEAKITGIETPTDLWPVLQGLSASATEVARQKTQRENELAAQAEAEQQARDYYNSLAGLRQRGYGAVAEGRNEAAWVAFLGRPGLGDGILQLEAAAPALETSDRAALTAAVQRVQDLAAAVHQQFATKLPQKVILISLAAEELWAYEDGRVAIHTLVTTGRPELPTDVGLMRVFRKNSPWLMRSPWGPGSPYWYPDLTVKYAMWFHPSGEAIHDSWWRGWYGPQSNLGGYGSHGCIGLPYGPIDQLFVWTPVDTPVVVIPGDGSPVSTQLARRTYNDPLMARLYGI